MNKELEPLKDYWFNRLDVDTRTIQYLEQELKVLREDELLCIKVLVNLGVDDAEVAAIQFKLPIDGEGG